MIVYCCKMYKVINFIVSIVKTIVSVILHVLFVIGQLCHTVASNLLC